MLTIYDDRNKKLMVAGGQDENLCRMICDNNPKLFKKNQDKEDRTIYTSLDGTEAKLPNGKLLYFYKDFRLEFVVS